MRKLKVGDVVELQTELLGNKVGSLGVVFEEYKLGDHAGVQVIFENGEYDGFSEEEQEKMLTRFGHEPSLAGYKFKNVMQVTKDYRSGVFDVVFN